MGEIHISKSCYYIRGRANMFIVSTLLFRDKKRKKIHTHNENVARTAFV